MAVLYCAMCVALLLVTYIPAISLVAARADEVTRSDGPGVKASNWHSVKFRPPQSSAFVQSGFQAANSILYRARWRAHRVATSGIGPPLIKAANWLSHLEFDVGSPVWSHLLGELSAPHHAHPITTTWLRAVGSRRRRPIVDACLHDLGRSSMRRSRALSFARNFAGRIDRRCLRSATPATRVATDSARRLRTRPFEAQSHPAAVRGGRSNEPVGRDRVGPAKPGFPAVFHDAIHSKRHR